MILNDCKTYEIKLSQNQEEIFACLKALLEEFREYKTSLNSIENLCTSEKVKLFKRAFEFRARPFVWAVETLLKIAQIEKLTDIHFEPLSDQVKITFRRAGRVFVSGEIDYPQFQRFLARIKFLAGCLSHVSDKAQEGAFRDESNGLDVRASTFPTDLGERLSLRFISPLRYNSLDSLGWAPGIAQQWRNSILGGAGLFVISGAVGSGKTTALYATLAELAGNNRQLRVVTLEDPVEGRIKSICQSSLDSMKDLTLSQAFKHLLRQDPDIIALGEIRDRECLKEALQAGLSGHIVFATFHAGSAGEAIDRIKQMGIDEYLVMSGLRGILHLELSYSESGVSAKAEIINNREHLK